MSASLTTLAVALGFVLDWIIGDPQGVWHPICAIGSLISGTEKLLRRLFPATPRGEKIAGVFLWVIVCGLSFLVPLAILFLLGRVNPWLACVVQTIFCCQIFARKCLVDAGNHVRRALEQSLDEGRRAIAMYVGRDTGALTEEGVIKATVETIAENTTDGVIAPMIFMLIGGAPLGFLYKAVNTLDSMVGYHNDKYEHFGWCSAKMDDVFNFIPARIAAVCMVAGAGMLKFDSRNARRIFQRDRFKHKSPNSAQTESVCAGALHVQLGGPAPYFGKMVHKPTIGDSDRAIVKSDIGRAADLMTTASVFALLLGLTIRLSLTFTPFSF
ncbi:MAG: adenosylcobinamide-phosphate synthase CbiB [Butyricicoccus sp.]